MLFNSIQFAVFFIIVTITYFFLPYKYRWLLLLLASCYFYMAFVPIYILILAFTIGVDYIAGIAIEKARGRRRKLFLICSLIANIGILAAFKYYDFLNYNFTFLLNEFGYRNPLPYLSILLPIGLSFHTFQAMSYTIEVYRGNQSAEHHFGIYSLYVMFYPQLVAGPIERPQNLLHQFREKFRFDYTRVTEGLRQMAWGLFKKVVIADRLAIVVNTVYDKPENYNSFNLILATVFFSFQIYCDFSGYSDIAIGAAKVMGFKLMKNFDSPYQSKSVEEFWKRWHISLSTWFRDYLYISLGGNRVAIPRWYLNLFIVFLVSGLWHGANWTFIVWGALHGSFLIIEKAAQRFRKNKKINSFKKYRYKLIPALFTFSLVTIAWIFFRADNLHKAVYILEHIFLGIKNVDFNALIQNVGLTKREQVLCIGLIFFLEITQFLERKYYISNVLLKSPVFIRWTVYYIFIASIILLGEFNQSSFIYFQF